MKEIKAFIHSRRAGDVLRALREAETSDVHINNLAVFPVQALLREPRVEETRYSLEFGEVVGEVKLELLCPDSAVAPLVELIKRVAHTSGREEGWIVVTDTIASESIGSGGGKP